MAKYNSYFIESIQNGLVTFFLSTSETQSYIAQALTKSDIQLLSQVDASVKPILQNLIQKREETAYNAEPRKLLDKKRTSLENSLQSYSFQSLRNSKSNIKKINVTDIKYQNKSVLRIK